MSAAERRVHACYSFADAVRRADGWGPDIVLKVCRRNVANYVLANFQQDWVLRKTVVFFEDQFEEEITMGLNRPADLRCGGHAAELYHIFFEQVLSVPGLWEIEPVTGYVLPARARQPDDPRYVDPSVCQVLLQVVGGMMAKSMLEGFCCPI
eukprot:SAG31_NODE_15524_length_750_cov_1.341014_1_plen_151_part_01